MLADSRARCVVSQWVRCAAVRVDAGVALYIDGVACRSRAAIGRECSLARVACESRGAATSAAPRRPRHDGLGTGMRSSPRHASRSGVCSIGGFDLDSRRRQPRIEVLDAMSNCSAQACGSTCSPGRARRKFAAASLTRTACRLAGRARARRGRRVRVVFPSASISTAAAPTRARRTSKRAFRFATTGEEGYSSGARVSARVRAQRAVTSHARPR